MIAVVEMLSYCWLNAETEFNILNGIFLCSSDWSETITGNLVISERIPFSELDSESRNLDSFIFRALHSVAVVCTDLQRIDILNFHYKHAMTD